MARKEDPRALATAGASKSVHRQPDASTIAEKTKKGEYENAALSLWGLDFMRGFYAVASGNLRPLTRAEARFALGIAARLRPQAEPSPKQAAWLVSIFDKLRRSEHV